MITTHEVRQRLLEIKSLADEGDFEAAHSEEDKLHREVLRYVFDNSPTWSTMHILAKLALQSGSIEFARHAA